MPRVRPPPAIDELLEALREQGVEGMPTEAPDEEQLRGVLDFALWVADHRKRVDFAGFSWQDPRFAAVDAKVRVGVAYARVGADEAIEHALRRSLHRAAGERALLALDARGTTLREFDVLHAIFGRVTLFRFPHKPHESADPRIDAARERGWVKTLKEHNLLPGRGIVVLDEDQGLLLRDAQFVSLLGFLLLTPDGHTSLHWNPFVKADRNDPELQYWLAWGEGTGQSSEWREMLNVADDEA